MNDIEAITSGLAGLQRLVASRQTFALALAAAGLEISQQEMQVLRIVWLEGSAPLGEIARRARMDAGAVSRQVPSLERAGLVARRPGPANTVFLELTDAGREAVDAFERVRNSHMRRALRNWSADDRRTFAELLRRFTTDTTSTPYQPSDRGQHASI